MQRELDVQVQVTQSFDQNRREIRTEYAKKAEEYRTKAEKLPQDSKERTDLEAKAKQIDDNLRLFDGITSAIYAPNSNGIVGDVARAVSPQVAYQIGQHFKQNNTEQSASHLLAHAILGAATSYATGNNIATGALSGVTSEATAPILASYLYGTKDPKELTQEQKDTITSIIRLGATGIAYGATDGSVADAVNASEVGKGSVENNTLKKSDADELLRQIAYARRHYDGVKLDEEMRRIRSLAAKLAHDNFKEVQACQNNPTPSCVNKIKTEYKDVNFTSLQDAYHEYQGTDKILSAYEFRNNSLNSCANTNFANCIITADGIKVMQEGAYAAIGIRGGGAVANGSGGTNRVARTDTKKADQPTTTQAKATCTTGTYCFTAGTLIETKEGLKAIETFTGGELIWTRNDITLEYGYRPVIATKATPDQPIFQVTVKNHQGDIETLETTAEHPFWIKDSGWLKASLLEQGMILLDRNNQEVEVLSQFLIPNHTDIVYNIEVDDFHTYHVGRLGVWVHNDKCCKLTPGIPEHKQARWEEYQSNPNSSNWDYERWSNTYDANMTKATQANKARDNYHSGLGWGETEVTVKVEVNGKEYNRRLDIADTDNFRAIEHKTGYQSRTEDVLWELKRDKELVKRGWNIEWVFEGDASKPLVEDLKKAGIKVKFKK